PTLRERPNGLWSGPKQLVDGIFQQSQPLLLGRCPRVVCVQDKRRKVYKKSVAGGDATCGHNADPLAVDLG
ncbi:unnamed protein product, partial [Parascedosporium putredinis]